MLRVWIALLLGGMACSAAASVTTDYLTLLTAKIAIMPFVLEYSMAVFVDAYGRRRQVSLLMPRCVLYGLCLVLISLSTTAVVVTPEANVPLTLTAPVVLWYIARLIRFLVRTAARSGAVGATGR